jgi:hypothetical protein
MTRAQAAPPSSITNDRDQPSASVDRGLDTGRLAVFASNSSAALPGVIFCTLLRTRAPVPSLSVGRPRAAEQP